MADPAGNLVDKIEVFKEELPLLFDAKGQPLKRPAGFRHERKEPTR